MGELDIRKSDDEMVDMIRFADDGFVIRKCHAVFAITENGTDTNTTTVFFDTKDISNLIKALRKYQELYG